MVQDDSLGKGRASLFSLPGVHKTGMSCFPLNVDSQRPKSASLFATKCWISALKEAMRQR
jgi:hypothetical protein